MPTKWDKAGNLDKMLDFMNRAAANSPDLITTPEGCLEGYVVMEAISEGRGQEMLELAEPEDGESVARFRDLCRTRKVNALIGMCERVGDEAYNTALWIGRDGDTVGKYSKTHFAEGIAPGRFYNTPGAEAKGFDTEFCRVGIMICFDRRVPELARCLARDGAQIFLIPSYGCYTGWNDPVLIARAHENDVPVVFTHPKKTIVIKGGGDVQLISEQQDAISHFELEIPDAPMSYFGPLLRPEMYGPVAE